MWIILLIFLIFIVLSGLREKYRVAQIQGSEYPYAFHGPKYLDWFLYPFFRPYSYTVHPWFPFW